MASVELDVPSLCSCSTLYYSGSTFLCYSVTFFTWQSVSLYSNLVEGRNSVLCTLLICFTKFKWINEGLCEQEEINKDPWVLYLNLSLFLGFLLVSNGINHSPPTLNGAPSPPQRFSNGPASSTSSALTNQQLPATCGARQLSKLKRFLTTLQQFGNDISPEIGEKVRTLVLALVVSTVSLSIATYVCASELKPANICTHFCIPKPVATWENL